MAKYRIINGEGPQCEVCKVPSEIREHGMLTEKQLRQPFYYTRWFNCRNTKCRRTIFMQDQYKVMNRNKAARQYKDLTEDRENRERFNSLF